MCCAPIASRPRSDTFLTVHIPTFLYIFYEMFFITCLYAFFLFLYTKVCMAQHSVSPESSSPPLKHLLCLTHLTTSLTSKLTCRLFDRPRPVLLSGTAASLMVFPRQHMSSFGMMLSANRFNHRMMDRTQSSSELTNISPSTSRVVTTLSLLTVSNLHILILKTRIPHHKLHSQPPHSIEPPDLVDVLPSLSTSAHMCPKTLGAVV